MGLDKYFREGYEEPKSGTANRRAQPWHVSLLLFFRQREEREEEGESRKFVQEHHG